MCFVSKPKIPKPAPAPPPPPVLDQAAPELTKEKQRKARSNRSGTKRYRAEGGSLTIPSGSSAKTGGLKVPGGG